MADDNKQVFSLDLDITGFTENALKAQGSISKIGNSENLVGLTEGLLQAGALLGVLGVAALALKTTFDLVFEGEQIQRTNNLFEAMAKNAGIVGDALKEDLVKAAGGFADTTDILNVANKAIVAMGESAKKLPEIMDLARKYTQAFGGELTQNFERLTFAISTGSQKALRQMGIVVDTTKAQQDYARSLGVSVDELTEAGKRQAILNEVLAKGQQTFKDVADGQQNVINSYQLLKTSIKDLTEVFVVLFSKTLGPLVNSFIASWANFTALFKDKVMVEFGSDSERTANKISLVKDEMASLKITMDDLQKQAEGKTFWTRIMGPSEEAQKELEVRKEQYKKLQEELLGLETTHAGERQKLDKQQSELDKNSSQESFINKEKYARDDLKLQEEIMRMKEENNKRTIELADNEATLVKAREEENVFIAQEAALKKQQIEEELSQGKIHTREEADQMELLLEEQKNQKLLQLEEQKNSQFERMDENYLKHSQNVYDGIGRAAQASADKANRSLHNFGQQGTIVMDVIKKRGEDAFMAFGKSAVDHSQSASEIMKGFFLNSLADIAQAQGELYMAAGLGGDFTKLAAGASLLALSGALRAMAGSAGGGSSGYGGGSGGGGGSYGSSDTGALGGSSPAAQEHKSLTIQVQGHYFETEQTRQKIMDLVRESTDITDYKYVQIGGQ